MADQNPDLEAALQAEFRRGFELGETNQRLRCGDCTNTIAVQVRADALMEAHDDLEKVAERLEAKGGAHRGTAGGVHLACFRLIELADARPSDIAQETR